ncbi:MAG: DUF3291 domain-containing protein [Luteibaculaceae bacterium]
MVGKQVVTISFFRFEGLLNKLWAFAAMGKTKGLQNAIEGAQFVKFMGTGGGDGYQWHPDFSTYSILIAWQNEEKAHKFFNSSTLYSDYSSRAFEQCTFWLNAIAASGMWDGVQPFEIYKQTPEGPIAVITRATIKTKNLIQFWRKVPNVSASILEYPSKLFGKGVGEWPLFQQATFSVWANREDMLDYAYKNKKHREVVKLTKEIQWYSEELFARFIPYKVEGTWFGKKPIPNF